MRHPSGRNEDAGLLVDFITSLDGSDLLWEVPLLPVGGPPEVPETVWSGSSENTPPTGRPIDRPTLRHPPTHPPTGHRPSGADQRVGDAAPVLLADVEPEAGDVSRPRATDRFQVDPGEARGGGGCRRQAAPASHTPRSRRLSSTSPRRRHWPATSARSSRFFPPAASSAVATASPISPVRNVTFGSGGSGG